jgi:hypothetical protein
MPLFISGAAFHAMICAKKIATQPSVAAVRKSKVRESVLFCRRSSTIIPMLVDVHAAAAKIGRLHNLGEALLHVAKTLQSDPRILGGSLHGLQGNQ